MNNKSITLFVFTMLCIVVNILGAYISFIFEPPFWLDCIGTAFAAYVLGPFGGAMVGLSSSLSFGIHNPSFLAYGIVEVLVGIIIGIYSEKKYMENIYGVFKLSVLVTAVTVTASMPLNYIVNKGSLGNSWGEGVYAFCRMAGLSKLVSGFMGQLYLEFLDKVFVLLILYHVIKLKRYLKENKGISILNRELVLIMGMTGAVLTGCLPATRVAEAATNQIKTDFDYSSYIQTVYGKDNGISCGEANDISQTNDGVLWIGTYAGLYRYTGNEFKWMDKLDSVKNVNCLFTDDSGRLWVGTNDNGLSILVDGQVQSLLNTKMGMPSNSVKSISAGEKGIYYVGTAGYLVVVELDGAPVVKKVIKEASYVENITTDDYGHVVALDGDGKLNLIREECFLTSCKSKDASETFTGCCFGRDGKLYAGTSGNNIVVYDIINDKFVESYRINTGKLTFINKLDFSERDEMFVCADNGVGYYKDKTFYIVNTNAFNNSIEAMEVDYQGNLWFASSRMGLLRMCRSPFINVFAKVGIERSVTNAIVSWNNHIYIGTDNGMIAMDNELNSIYTDKVTEMLKDVRIRCMICDKKGALWVCTYGMGLIKIDKSFNVKRFDGADKGIGDKSRVVIELSDGTIVAAGSVGISYIKNDTVVKSYESDKDMGSSPALTLMEMEDGSVMAGTDGDGIYILSEEGIKEIYSVDKGLSSDIVLRTVLSQKNGGIYIITSSGLCYMDKNKKIRKLDKFPYFNNFDLWESDDGNVFVLGSAGIYVMKSDELLANEDDARYVKLDSTSGLEGALVANSWNYMDKDGDFYLATDKGLFTVNVNQYLKTENSYRMEVYAIEADGKNVTVERGLDINIHSNAKKITIYPEVINYNVEKPLIMYQLKGFDEEPVVVTQEELNSIVYPNIPRGKYTFSISILDPATHNEVERSSYNIVKEKKIYDNLWFIAYMIVVGVAMVAWVTWGVVRMWTNRTIERQERELEFTKKQLQMGNETIIAIAKTVDAKDENTSQHSARVSMYSVMIAKELGFDEAECENLRKAALLHDIGKIGIKDAILNKPARLTDEEYEIMKTHVTRGAEILKDFTLVDHVIEGALYHHEKYDGTGYAHGLKGEEIPLYGRIIGVADAFDAMTANRVYRKQLDFDFVINELKRCSGTQFDPKIADIMLKLIDEGKISKETLYGAVSKGR